MNDTEFNQGLTNKGWTHIGVYYVCYIPCGDHFKDKDGVDIHVPGVSKEYKDWEALSEWAMEPGLAEAYHEAKFARNKFNEALGGLDKKIRPYASLNHNDVESVRLVVRQLQHPTGWRHP